MEPTPDMFHAIMYPTAAFTPTLAPEPSPPSSPTPWEGSPLNPKNRIDSLTAVLAPTWRLDGGEMDGTRFFVTPSFALNRSPLRIDVHIPTPAEHAPEVRGILKSHAAMLVDGSSQLAHLPIAQLVLRILERWSSSHSNTTAQLAELYHGMPFGSRIVIDRICTDTEAIAVHLIPNYDVEQQWLSPDALQRMWSADVDCAAWWWPEERDLSCVQLQRQLHDAIALVTMAGHHGGDEPFVFKAATADCKFLYHELKLLLRMAPHANVVARPLYIVTKRCRFGGKVGVCGFVLRYYAAGTLQQTLATRSRGGGGSLALEEQFRWAREVTGALLHIRESPAGFYSDVKLNNIIMDERADGLHAVVVDFEQRGGWYSWSPPEVYYTEYLEHVASSPHVPEKTREKYTAVLRKWRPDWAPKSRSVRYWNPEFGFSVAWTSLTEPERERAMVFMLGKLLWCLFEGVGSINACVTPETFRDELSEQHFPEFRRTPEAMRACIRRYTSGAPEWEGRYPAIVRRGNKLFPRERYEKFGAAGCTAFEAQEAARQWWKQELADAERFLENRSSKCAEGLGGRSITALQDGRPLLKDVLRDVQGVEQEMLTSTQNRGIVN
ncbi:hypothetical protein F5882DRAFT_490062 [Hyaloscypha sp. PMI_1271]|nr:hypothetical protein F5882DRAFT_490062 [Hyaloscypha sp. PMI_1271]